MKDEKKAKWILGATGVALSAIILTQFNDEPQMEVVANNPDFTNEQLENM